MAESTGPVHRFSQRVIVSASHLLNMWYTPSELAEELDIAARTIRDWTRQDLPHRKDNAGRLWIDGRELATWVKNHQSQPQVTLQSNEGFCLKCKVPVVIQNAYMTKRGKMQLLTGQCPQCTSTVYRGVASDQPG
jgi:hypothetical protein